MKFEYGEDKDRGACVAYIDDDGDLMIASEDKCTTICMSIKYGYCSGDKWNPSVAIHKFYPGDKITITF